MSGEMESWQFVISFLIAESICEIVNISLKLLPQPPAYWARAMDCAYRFAGDYTSPTLRDIPK